MVSFNMLRRSLTAGILAVAASASTVATIALAVFMIEEYFFSSGSSGNTILASTEFTTLITVLQLYSKLFAALIGLEREYVWVASTMTVLDLRTPTSIAIETVFLMSRSNNSIFFRRSRRNLVKELGFIKLVSSGVNPKKYLNDIS